MKNKFLLCILFLLIVGIYIPISNCQSYQGFPGPSPTPTYTLAILNSNQVSSSEYQCDIYITRTGTTPLELSIMQLGLKYNNAVKGTGVLTVSYADASVDTAMTRSGETQTFTAATTVDGYIRLAGHIATGGHGTGALVPTAPGMRVGRLKIVNSVPLVSTNYGLVWSYDSLYATKVFAYCPDDNKGYDITIPTTSKTLTLTAFLEGYTNPGGTAMLYAPSAVTVELHTAASPYTLVESQTAPLNTAGVGIYTFINAGNGISYYITVKSLNTIETWSAAAQSFSSDILSYDFTSAATQAYQSNMTQKGGAKWCIYSGDVDQDHYVNLTDLIEVNNAAYYIITGAVATDLTGDLFTNITDLIIVNNNAYYGIQALSPSFSPAASITKPIDFQIKTKNIK